MSVITKHVEDPVEKNLQDIGPLIVVIVITENRHRRLSLHIFCTNCTLQVHTDCFWGNTGHKCAEGKEHGTWQPCSIAYTRHLNFTRQYSDTNMCAL